MRMELKSDGQGRSDREGGGEYRGLTGGVWSLVREAFQGRPRHRITGTVAPRVINSAACFMEIILQLKVVPPRPRSIVWGSAAEGATNAQDASRHPPRWREALLAHD